MPLMHGKSNKAFESNVKREMHEGKPQKQSLAIAYSIKRHAKKMNKGGAVETLHPQHEPEGLVETHTLPDERETSLKQNHDHPMEHPAEPMEHVEPMQEDMGRTDPDDERIMRAVRMAMGGSVDEHQPMEEDADRKLAMNDTYPPGAAESDTQAQDENYGDEPMHNETSSEDQEEARRKTRAARALTMARMNG